MQPQAVERGRRKRRRKDYVCEECGKVYGTWSSRYHHYKTHIGKREYTCTLCQKSFMYKSTLTSHHRFTHLKEKPYICFVCAKGFSFSSHLNSHMLSHTEDRSWQCPICHKYYRSSYSKIHMKKHENIRDFECTECGARFTERSGLRCHMRKHTGERPYVCEVCEATFAYRNCLVIHQRTHTGERPYKCDLCPAVFSQSTHKRTHSKLVHNISKPSLKMKHKRVDSEGVCKDEDFDK